MDKAALNGYAGTQVQYCLVCAFYSRGVSDGQLRMAPTRLHARAQAGGVPITADKKDDIISGPGEGARSSILPPACPK